MANLKVVENGRNRGKKISSQIEFITREEVQESQRKGGNQ